MCSVRHRALVARPAPSQRAGDQCPGGCAISMRESLLRRDGQGDAAVATPRVGDVAVALHPEGSAYAVASSASLGASSSGRSSPPRAPRRGGAGHSGIRLNAVAAMLMGDQGMDPQSQVFPLPLQMILTARTVALDGWNRPFAAIILMIPHSTHLTRGIDGSPKIISSACFSPVQCQRSWRENRDP